jgi:hypothetical protein
MLRRPWLEMTASTTEQMFAVLGGWARLRDIFAPP